MKRVPVVFDDTVRPPSVIGSVIGSLTAHTGLPYDRVVSRRRLIGARVQESSAEGCPVSGVRLTIVWSVFAVLALTSSSPAPVTAAEAPATMSELERYIRIQIDIGAAMKDFFSRMGPNAGSPPAGEREAMVEQIDQTVAEILKRYELTTEEYNRRKKEVFKDAAAVTAFLEAHPELKAKWEALPFRGGGGHGRRPPSDE